MQSDLNTKVEAVMRTMTFNSGGGVAVAAEEKQREVLTTAAKHWDEVAALIEEKWPTEGGE
jgi:hypothetical protein